MVLICSKFQHVGVDFLQFFLKKGGIPQVGANQPLAAPKIFGKLFKNLAQ
jgi:hypothetical protein